MGYRQGGYGQYDERILQVIREEFCRNDFRWIQPIPEKHSGE